jgi:hypothetical protein
MTEIFQIFRQNRTRHQSRDIIRGGSNQYLTSHTYSGLPVLTYTCSSTWHCTPLVAAGPHLNLIIYLPSHTSSSLLILTCIYAFSWQQTPLLACLSSHIPYHLLEITPILACPSSPIPNHLPDIREYELITEAHAQLSVVGNCSRISLPVYCLSCPHPLLLLTIPSPASCSPPPEHTLEQFRTTESRGGLLLFIHILCLISYTSSSLPILTCTYSSTWHQAPFLACLSSP